MDMQMPVLDGFGVLKALRTRDDTRGIPVVVLSANIMESTKRQALDLGAQQFIQKPFDPKCLIEAIKSAMAPPHCHTDRPPEESDSVVAAKLER